MIRWASLLPRHRACCDAANDAHVHLVQAMRQRDEAILKAATMSLQLDEQVQLNESIVRFLSVVTL